MTRVMLAATSAAELRSLMRQRRSIRRYSAQPVPAEVVRELLTAAADAPSAHNRQPWRFAVLTESEKERLASTMGSRLREERAAAGDDAIAIANDVASSYDRITHAPVAILVSASTIDMDRYADTNRAEAERTMAVQSTAMAVQNLLLVAYALGYGACSMCAPLFCQPLVREILDLPADWEPQTLVTLGIPASSGKPRARRKLADVVRAGDVP